MWGIHISPKFFLVRRHLKANIETNTFRVHRNVEDWAF